MEEEGKAVACAGAGILCVLEQPRHRGAIDHVVDHEVGRQKGSGDKAGVGAFHAEGGRIDDEINAGQLLAQVGLLERNDRDGVFRAFEPVAVEELLGALGDVMRFAFRAVDQDKARTFFERTLQRGGGTRAAAGAEDHDAEVAEVEGEDFADGADESRAVGVEADDARAVEEEGVDRAELAGGVVEFGAECEGFELVGDGEVESDEFGAAGEVDGLGELLGRAFNLGVAEVGTEGLKRRVVHGGGKGVLDGGTKDGEANFGRNGAAAFGAGAEVVQGEGRCL